jgi:hypothetical protein
MRKSPLIFDWIKYYKIIAKFKAFWRENQLFSGVTSKKLEFCD